VDKDCILERLDGKYTIDKKTNCWIWNGTTEKNGKYYPQLSIDCTIYYVHKLMAYVHSNTNNINSLGPIEHSCKNKRCINPDHLKFNKNSITGFSLEMDGVIVKYMEDSKTTNKDKAIVDLLSIGIYYYYYVKEEV
jgi:hypothetical protein